MKLLLLTDLTGNQHLVNLAYVKRMVENDNGTLVIYFSDSSVMGFKESFKEISTIVKEN